MFISARTNDACGYADATRNNCLEPNDYVASTTALAANLSSFHFQVVLSLCVC